MRLANQSFGLPEQLRRAGVFLGLLPGQPVRDGALADVLPPHLSTPGIAAACLSEARLLFPRDEAPSRVVPCARLMMHRSGAGPDSIEPVVGLLRWSRLPLLEPTPDTQRRVRLASLDVDTRDLVTITDLLGHPTEAERFERLCTSLHCLGRRYLPDGGDESRRALRASLAGECSPLAQAPQVDAPVLTVTVGIPGSGKTTWLDRTMPEATIISMDRMRQALLGSMSDQRENDRIHRDAMAATTSQLRDGRSVVFDATSYSVERRERLVSIADTTGARVRMIYFDIGLEEALNRNAARGRSVPRDVIIQMYSGLEAPRADEADEVTVVSTAWGRSRRWEYGAGDWVWQAI